MGCEAACPTKHSPTIDLGLATVLLLYLLLRLGLAKHLLALTSAAALIDVFGDGDTGTGKTTAVVEIILQEIARGAKVITAA